MHNRQAKTAAVFAFTAAMLLASFVVNAAEQSPESKPAIELGTPFADGAILQRQMTVPVWGWSKPGTKVTVEFTGQNKTAIADKNGKWTLQLDPLTANAVAAQMVVSDSSGNRTVLENILVGEVWMASGQSNMQWLAGSCIVGRKLIPQIKARVEAGDEEMPVIREGKVTDVFSSLYPTERAQGKWSDDWPGFSAISFAFAYDLAKELKVPIGIVNCAFSTTQIQAWTPVEGFAAGTDDYTKAIYQKILEGDHRTPQHKAAWKAYYLMNATSDLPIKAWVGYQWLKQVPAWKADGEDLYSRYAPDPKVYAANAETYINDWKAYWKNVSTNPAFEAGAIPRFPGARAVETPATMTYNMLIAAFGPGNFKGVICLTPESFMGEDEGADFGKQFSVMANSWKETFADGKQVIDPHFFYTIPSKTLAPKITAPAAVKGKSTAYEMKEWLSTYDPKTRKSAVDDELKKFLDAAVKAVYR